MLDARAFDDINADTDHAHVTGSVGRLTRSRPLTRSTELPVDVARVSAAPFCEPRKIGAGTDALQIGWLSFGIIRHCGEHFLDGIFQTHPHRTRYDCVADVEFAQTRNVVDERDVFVIDPVAGVDLHIGF